LQAQSSAAKYRIAELRSSTTLQIASGYRTASHESGSNKTLSLPIKRHLHGSAVEAFTSAVSMVFS